MGLDMHIYKTPQNNIKSNGTDLVNDDMVFKDIEDYFFMGENIQIYMDGLNNST